jgi:2-(1,2-epoxy-1,2-dihydrophenyl)acetyl-CoA isomerase
MSYEAILFEKRGPIGIITLNRPERLNAVSTPIRTETHAAVEECREDDNVRVIIITGAGKGFCSGADLSGAGRPAGEAGAPPPRPVTNQNTKLDEMHWVGHWAKMLYETDKPTIAAVNGVCAGAGMSLALSADMRVGSENARFKAVFAERNLSPDSGMSFFLPRIVGYSRAIDIICSSRNVEAEEAYRIGLLDRLVKHANLVEEAVKVAEGMAQLPPVAIRASKRVVQRNMNVNLHEAVMYEAYNLDIARKATNDAKESRVAFVEKRKGVFTGT